ncbi:MAG: hypothetical protein AB1348_05325 [Nitrospirota bacterium]
MKESQVVAQLQFLESLKKAISLILENFLKTQKHWEKGMLIKSGKKLWEQYFNVYSKINELLEFSPYEGLQPIINPSSDSWEDWYATLLALLPQIDKGIGGLQSKISPLSSNEALELRALKEEIQEVLQEMPEEYDKNIRRAIEEIEKGYFLGSALISARVINYVLDQIKGGKIEEKIETLRKAGLIEEKGEIPSEYVLKADRKARHYFSHDIKALPDCNEALELLTICVRVLKLLKNYQTKEV